jgi:hypothetical protein
MGPLKTSPEGYKYLLNMIDLFTIWPEAIPLKKLTAEETTKAFQILVTRRSCPIKVLSDRGTSFTSKLFAYVCISSSNNWKGRKISQIYGKLIIYDD